MARSSKTCVIWRVVDGKRGHERQTQGLVAALRQLLEVEVQDIPCEPGWLALWHGLAGVFPQGEGLHAPDLILGAGHGTHLDMLAAQRAHGGKTVVLMKPSLPLGCFDLCLVPEHDGVRPAANVLATRGALNPLQPPYEKIESAGLMLVGGVSRHMRWDGERIVAQVREVASRCSDVQWELTTSPRTPDETLACLNDIRMANLTVTPYAATGQDWLPPRLARAARVWVTPDSVSMLYEALTSGAAVGIFAMQPRGHSRVGRGIARLCEEGRVTGYMDWLAGASLQAGQQEFNEAARCARWIRDNWFPQQ